MLEFVAICDNLLIISYISTVDLVFTIMLIFMTYYRKQLAIIYGMDCRTFLSRCIRENLLPELPKLKVKKALFDERDFSRIKRAIGPPGFTPKYVRD